MKITILVVLGLSFFRSVEGNLGAPIGSLGHDEDDSEAFEVSNFQRKLAYDAAPQFNIVVGGSGCDFDPDFSAGTIGAITCSFDAVGGEGHDVSSAVYAADDCATTMPEGVEQDTAAATYSDGTYTVTINIENNAAPTDSGPIVFCLKAEVKDSADIVYDWIGQVVRLNVDVNGNFGTLNGQFSTGATLTTETFSGIAGGDEAVEAGLASFGVDIFRCDDEGSEVTDDLELSVGENFFLCVVSEQSAVVINNIRELTATKTDVANLSLIAAVDGDNTVAGDPNTNTFVFANSAQKVVIATRLPTMFFANNEAVTISGYANIAMGGSRRLVRIMQEASASTVQEEESAEFSMEVAIVGLSGASGASAIKATAAVFFGAVAAFFLV